MIIINPIQGNDAPYESPLEGFAAAKFLPLLIFFPI